MISRPRAKAICLPALACAVGLTAAGCPKDGGGAERPHFRVPIVDLEMPKLAGWIIDKSVAAPDPAKGGEVFRLVRESNIPGAPRVMVLLEPLKTQRTLLESFLTENLREMAHRETAGGLHIVQVDQRPVRVGPRNGYRIRHEYTVGEGSAQIAITQVSTLLVLDGRGVAVTAAGRTELFHPVAESVEMMLNGLRTRSSPTKAGKGQPSKNKSLVEPIDLGELGGKKK